MTSHLYSFTGDSVIPEGIIKLAITLVEPPWATTVVIDFLTVKCPLAFNEVLGRPLQKALKVMASFHYLTMKFPTVAGISQVWGRQRNSRECDSKSLKLAKMGPGLSQVIEVEKISCWLMVTNINPRYKKMSQS